MTAKCEGLKVVSVKVSVLGYAMYCVKYIHIMYSTLFTKASYWFVSDTLEVCLVKPILILD